MNIRSNIELQNTREKLRLLEEQHAKRRQDLASDRHTRELSLRSIKRLINQLKEEIARYEAHENVHSGTSDPV